MAQATALRNEKTGYIEDVAVTVNGLDQAYLLDTYSNSTTQLKGLVVLGLIDVSERNRRDGAKCIVRFRYRADWYTIPSKQSGVQRLPVTDTAQDVQHAFKTACRFARGLGADMYVPEITVKTVKHPRLHRTGQTLGAAFRGLLPRRLAPVKARSQVHSPA